MSWLDTLRTGWEAIRSHRLRSGLTTLGILIGIAAVVLTVGLGEGAQHKVSSQISALGSNLLLISPGSSTDSGGVRGGLGSSSTLTVQDAGALASPVTAPDIAAVAPTSQRSESLTSTSTNWTTTVVGTTPDWLSVRARRLSSGRFITDADNTAGAAVTVLGPTTAAQLFGFGDPVGQSVTIAGSPYSVIGVLKSAGSSSTTNLDDQAIVPLSTATTRIFGGTSRNSVQSIYVEATSSGSLSAAYQEASNDLVNRHHNGTATSADFTITAQQSLLDTATSVSKTLTILLAGIAALSLLVGGIGVMNIMLVSVTERTREIGLRKALGARPAVIRRQFLVEASLLGVAGGVLGAGLGIVAALVVPHFISDPITISPSAIAVAIAVAIVIGVVFGTYPASRAAGLAPIDALRSE
ncbi:MAG: ABC transporter permease [Actinomycetota bacterium]|nr:ABC transporter permease [Actinomycetota bacterium]